MKVLVADEDVTTCLQLKAMVSKLGHECVIAEDGSSAWDYVLSGGIDVLLTDGKVPGAQGPELCRRVRDNPEGSYVYIVYTAGRDHTEDVVEAMAAGAHDCLTKPFDAVALQNRLTAAARITGLRRRLERTEVQLERANLALQEQSRTDQLTGLGNRQRLDEELEREHARAIRVERSYGIAIFDLDYFKDYDDHYGHVAGDGVLCRVATCIDLIMGSGESAYRFGGDEFLLLMPDCTRESEAASAANRIRLAVLDAAIPHEVRPADPRVVTVSAGVSCWTPGSPQSAHDVLEQALQALSDAKTVGRNGICTSATPPGGSGREMDYARWDPHDDRHLRVVRSRTHARPV